MCSCDDQDEPIPSDPPLWLSIICLTVYFGLVGGGIVFAILHFCFGLFPSN